MPYHLHRKSNDDIPGFKPGPKFGLILVLAGIICESDNGSCGLGFGFEPALDLS